MIGDLKENLKLREIEFYFDDSVIEYIVEKGFDKKFGARSLKRLIQKEIEDRIASIIIENYKKEIKFINATTDDSGIVLTF